MKRKIILLALSVWILISLIPFVSAVEVIEEDIGDYKYIKTRFYEEDEYFFPQHNLRYDNIQGNPIVITIVEFNDEKFGKDYLSDWISSKIEEDMSLFFYNNYIFKYNTESKKNLIWRSDNTYVKLQLYEDYSDLPNEVIEVYLDIYPSDCDKTNCIVQITLDKEEIYKFDEPLQLFWKVKQHIDTTYQCPEENSVSEIRKKVDKLTIIKEKISDDDIQVFKGQCENSYFFLIEGIETEGEIKECFDYLSRLLEDNNLSAPHNRWLYKECYVRDYFEERFNSETVADYNATYFENRLSERDQEFVDFIKYKIEFPKTTREEATEEGKEAIILEERNIDIEELENKTSELEKYEFLPAEKEEIKIPSKSLLHIIKEKIKSFFKWFK